MGLPGKLVAAAITAGFLYSTQLIKPYWGQILSFFGGDVQAYVWGTCAIHLAVLLAGNIFFLLGYTGLLPFLDKYKINKERAWPWEASNKPEKRAAFWSMVRWGAFLTVFNATVVAAPLAYGNYGLAVKLGFSNRLEDWPSPLRIGLSILAAMVVEDATFYTSHRLLHSWRWLYKSVHKLHHTFFFSVSIAAEATHPVESALGNALPFSIPCLLFGFHQVTMWAWLVWRILETVDGHSGYELPWSPFRLIPFSGSAYHHDAHHSLNTGNYSSFFTWWDKLCGTEIPHKAIEAFLHDASNGGAEGKEEKQQVQQQGAPMRKTKDLVETGSSSSSKKSN